MDEYEEIIYNSLFSLIDDLLEVLDDPRTIQIPDIRTYLFMQENAPCHKAIEVM